MNTSRTRIALSLGDPHGIGPEIVLRAMSLLEPEERTGITVFGPETALADAAKTVRIIPTDTSGYDRNNVGKETAGGGKCAIAALRVAAGFVLEGKADALVTCPVSKRAVSLAGTPFTGHTEFLAEFTGARRTVMMFALDTLRVALATTHLPLRRVPLSLTADKIMSALLVVHKGLRELFRIAKPRIAVCALNPHAGEGGLLGTEEEKVILPAMKDARAEGVVCEGPFPADSLFAKDGEDHPHPRPLPEGEGAVGGASSCRPSAAGGRSSGQGWIPASAGMTEGEANGKPAYDAILAMYHDQAMIPVKTLGFRRAVNITLGLPFVRTSPCHGVAYDIAGKGTADPTSLVEAIRLARRLAPAPESLF
ncbi:MAG: 4-hydroxythreonine-4-phosphate dehydrogenase PdxA [Planctomycetota bacterium]|nr:4-hydroxythreonine-4-phosphate dehydrogenase PdxA [Planctomycetota bacterium]